MNYLNDEDGNNFLMELTHKDNLQDIELEDVFIGMIEKDREIFHKLIEKINGLMDKTLSTRNTILLDDAKKSKLELCQDKWIKTIHEIESYEIQIKKVTNCLLSYFKEDENGTFSCQKFSMIKVVGFPERSWTWIEDDTPKEYDVPDIYGVYLFMLLDLFCFFSFEAMKAINIQRDIVSLFENDLQVFKESLVNEMESIITPIIESFNIKQEQMQKYMEQLINKKQKELKDKQDELKKLTINRNEIDAEKTGTLSVEQCVFLIGKIKRHYIDLRRDDYRSMGFPPETIKMVDEKTIKRYVEFWDQYLKGNKKQGRKPPRKDYSRNMTMEDYSKLINAVELDKYNKWRAKNGIVALHGKRPNQIGSKQRVD